jgi:hypothetical protein
MPATHRSEWNRRHGFSPTSSHSLSEIARKSKYSVVILKKVYDRGVGAHRTNPVSVRMKGTFKKGVRAPMSQKLSAEQWAYARVYAFLNKQEKGTRLNHDTDLLKK